MSTAGRARTWTFRSARGRSPSRRRPLFSRFRFPPSIFTPSPPTTSCARGACLSASGTTRATCVPDRLAGEVRSPPRSEFQKVGILNRRRGAPCAGFWHSLKGRPACLGRGPLPRASQPIENLVGPEPLEPLQRLVADVEQQQRLDRVDVGATATVEFVLDDVEQPPMQSLDQGQGLEIERLNLFEARLTIDALRRV